MEKGGNKNEDRLKSLETDFSNRNFSPGDRKAEEAEAGVGLEVDQKENCEQNAKQKKPRNSGEFFEEEEFCGQWKERRKKQNTAWLGGRIFFCRGSRQAELKFLKPVWQARKSGRSC